MSRCLALLVLLKVLFAYKYHYQSALSKRYIIVIFCQTCFATQKQNNISQLLIQIHGDCCLSGEEKFKALLAEYQMFFEDVLFFIK